MPQRSSFPRFPRLPLELRLLIWSAACRTERILPLLPGLAHLSPRVHPSLAVPPVLHACSESRRVAIKHYNLSFHPRIYTNPSSDHVMLHLFFPFQIVDFDLYTKPEAGYDWSFAPKKVAVLLDDVQFHQSDEDERESAWRGDGNSNSAWRKRLGWFSHDFLWSLRSEERGGVEEVTLLVVEPLTGRPNVTAQRVEFAEGVGDLEGMGEFLRGEMRDRVMGMMNWWRERMGEGETEEEGGEHLPVLRVRHAVCTAWNAEGERKDVSWSVDGMERRSAGEYADMEFGIKPVRESRPGVYYFSEYDPPWSTAGREKRIKGIRRDMRRLRGLFCDDVGLGPHVLWEQQRYGCATGMWCSGLVYRAKKQLLWMEEYEGVLPIDGVPVPNFDFDAFLQDRPGLPGFTFEGVQPHRNEDEGNEEEEEDPWEIETLRCNGLLYWP